MSNKMMRPYALGRELGRIDRWCDRASTEMVAWPGRDATCQTCLRA